MVTLPTKPLKSKDLVKILTFSPSVGGLAGAPASIRVKKLNWISYISGCQMIVLDVCPKSKYSKT